eukprot:GHUV01034542.1.p1 GENE.GHUV01034542.1~~GHUV01034542.1.p1  ORF type:complete len:102 (+),score=3.75 GHUV01034542.1:392-697(+)
MQCTSHLPTLIRYHHSLAETTHANDPHTNCQLCCRHRWWSEAVLGVDRWMCFDACPTYACLPHVAPRVKAVTPNAKLIVMVRQQGTACMACLVLSLVCTVQ